MTDFNKERISKDNNMEECGKMKIKGMCAEDIVNSLVSNGYDVVATQYAKNNYGKPLNDRVTIIEYCEGSFHSEKQESELPF